VVVKGPAARDGVRAERVVPSERGRADPEAPMNDRRVDADRAELLPILVLSAGEAMG
jgi:hypothetical protein